MNKELSIKRLAKFDISIIIPVYNVEKSLERCLDSIFNQNFTGTFEVIAVNDCSIDNSLEVLKLYQNRVPELKIIEHNVNKKLAQVRTTGMKIAKGDYVMHVDSDDWLLQNTLESIFAKCIETDADVLVYDYLIENEFGRNFLNNIKKEILTKDKVKVQHHFYGACWNKIVKKSLTHDMLYSKSAAINSMEALIYCSEILLRAKTICLYPNTLYVYSCNSSSITNATKPYAYLDNQLVL